MTKIKPIYGTTESGTETILSKWLNGDKMSAIQACAESGMNRACIQTKRILDFLATKKELEKLGYKLYISDEYFLINW